MIREVKAQTKVGVAVDIWWKALANELHIVFPKIMPSLVTDAHVIEGDGGLGTVYLFNFGPDVKIMTYQKEKVAEFDESVHRFALQVVEGGHLNLGFSFYKTTFQLTASGEQETLIDFTVEYEADVEETIMTSKTISSTLDCIKCLENHLVNGAT